MRVVVCSIFVSAFRMRELDCEDSKCVLESGNRTEIDHPFASRMFSENNLIPISKPKQRRKRSTPVKRKTKTVRRKPVKSGKKKQTKRLQVGGRRRATKNNKKKCVKRKK